MTDLGLLPRYRWLTLLLVLSALVLFALKTPVLWGRLTSPVQLQQSDAINVERALILLRGDELYPDSTQGGPYLYTAYPPVFFYCEAALLEFIHNPWVPGRLLALGGYLGCGLLLGWWIGREVSVLWGCLGALGLWLLPAWCRWGTMDRPDTFFLFFNFAAFLILYGEIRTAAPRYGWLAAAGALNAISILIKQTSLTLTLSYLLICLLRRDWKKTSVFFLSSLVPVATVVLGETWVTQGLFLKHVFTWLNTGYDWSLLKNWLLRDFFAENGWLLSLIVLLAVLKEQPLFLLLQMGLVSLELFSLGRQGGAENYWLGFSLYGLFFVLESLWAPWRKGFTADLWEKRLQWACLFLFAVSIVRDGMDRTVIVPSQAEVTMKQDALGFFAPGDALALDSDLMIMSGRRIWIQPYEYTRMVNLGFWSSEPLIRDVQSKKFGTIELYDLPSQYLLPEIVVAAIRANYHLTIRKYGRVWLSPNKT